MKKKRGSSTELKFNTKIIYVGVNNLFLNLSLANKQINGNKKNQLKARNNLDCHF